MFPLEQAQPGVEERQEYTRLECQEEHCSVLGGSPAELLSGTAVAYMYGVPSKVGKEQ